MDGWITIGTKIDTKSFDAQIKELEDKLDTLEQEQKIALKDVQFPQDKLLQYEKEIELTKNKLTDLYKKQNAINKTGFNNVQSSLKNVSSSLSGVIKKVTKWSLAIIGIRSVYLGIRQAMNTLMQYDSQLQANVDYLRFALANALKPVIEWIVNAMYEILNAIGDIIQTLTGHNIFKNSGIKDYEKAMKKSAGSAKEIKKTLAGFDEMNVIAVNSSAGGGGVTPPPEGEVGNNDNTIFDKLKRAWQEVGEEMRKALNNPEVLDQAFGKWGKAVEGVIRTFYGLYQVINGIIDVVKGVFNVVVGIITSDSELIKQGWASVWEGIKELFIGTWNIIIGIFETGIGIVIGLVKLIGEMFVAFVKGVIEAFKQMWTNIKNTWNTIKDWFKEKVIDPLLEKWKTFKTKVVDVFSSIKTKATDVFGSIKTFILDKVITPVTNAFNAFKTSVTNVFLGIGSIFKTIGNIFIDSMNTIIKGLNKISIKVPDWVPEFGGKKWGFNINEIPRLARGGIVNNPGQGVNMGSYIAGEKGPEAVLPLDDATMDRLGEAIARHMNISANIVNTMNGRVISRELQKINAENSFAFNS